MIYKGEQGGEDWHAMRLGRVGGSECAPLLIKPKKGELLGTGALTLLDKKIAETITGMTADNYVSADMDKGTELEPDIIKAYEQMNFVKVEKIKYVSDGALFGFSPDGFVGKDGLIECKYKKQHVFAKYVRTGIIENSHMCQMQWGLMMTGRQWCDYAVFNPRFKKPLIVERVDRNELMIEAFKEAKEAYEKEWNRVLTLY